MKDRLLGSFIGSFYHAKEKIIKKYQQGKRMLNKYKAYLYEAKPDLNQLK